MLLTEIFDSKFDIEIDNYYSDFVRMFTTINNKEYVCMFDKIHSDGLHDYINDFIAIDDDFKPKRKQNQDVIDKLQKIKQKLDNDDFLNLWAIQFGVNTNYGTDYGLTSFHDSINVFDFVKQCITTFLKNHHNLWLVYTSDGNSRTSLYQKLIKKYAKPKDTINIVLNQDNISLVKV